MGSRVYRKGHQVECDCRMGSYFRLGDLLAVVARMTCEHCGETYHEDNMDYCVNCGANTCPRCAQVASLPRRKPREWWCDHCLSSQRSQDKET
jgi:hypothetical protein